MSPPAGEGAKIQSAGSAGTLVGALVRRRSWAALERPDPPVLSPARLDPRPTTGALDRARCDPVTLGCADDLARGGLATLIAKVADEPLCSFLSGAALLGLLRAKHVSRAQAQGVTEPCHRARRDRLDAVLSQTDPRRGITGHYPHDPPPPPPPGRPGPRVERGSGPPRILSARTQELEGKAVGPAMESPRPNRARARPASARLDGTTSRRATASSARQSPLSDQPEPLRDPPPPPTAPASSSRGGAGRPESRRRDSIRVADGLPRRNAFGARPIEFPRWGASIPRWEVSSAEIPHAAMPERPAHPKMAHAAIAGHGLVPDLAKGSDPFVGLVAAGYSIAATVRHGFSRPERRSSRAKPLVPPWSLPAKPRQSSPGERPTGWNYPPPGDGVERLGKVRLLHRVPLPGHFRRINGA